MAISMVVIPTMVRLAPRLKMIDMPDPRKVHAIPVARVGGWGITLGALLPFVLASPMDPVISTYVFGAVVLVVFGTLDDCFEMGHYPKFIGQFLATIPLGRFSTALDVANAALYLASDEAAFISGVNIEVDGARCV